MKDAGFSVRLWAVIFFICFFFACEPSTSDDLFRAIQMRRADRVQKIVKDHPQFLGQPGKKGFTPLLLAISKKDPRITEILLTAGAKTDQRNQASDHPLHVAVDTRSVDLVKLLLAHHSDVNALDDNGETALRAAVGMGNAKLAQILIAAGADLQVTDRYGRGALEIAEEEGTFELIALLRKHGAKTYYDNDVHDAVITGNLKALKKFLIKKRSWVNAKGSRENRPLHYACMNDRVKMALLLLQKGADVNAQSGTGNAPLHECSFLGAKKTAALFLKSKANVNLQNKKGETPLHFAVREKRDSVIDLLLSKADVSLPDRHGKTVLHDATLTNNLKLVQKLLRAGAPVQAKDKNGRTPLFFASDEAILTALIRKGAQASSPDAKGARPLEQMVDRGCRRCAQVLLHHGASFPSPTHAAAAEGDLPKLEHLIKEDADIVSLKDSFGQTPLDYAALWGQAETSECLLSKGASPSKTTMLHPIHKAALSGAKNVILILLKHKMDVDTEAPETAETALHFAARKGDADIVHFLLQNGADVNALTTQRETALHMVADHTMSGIVARTLMEAGVDRAVQNDRGETALDIAEWRGETEKNRKLSAQAKTLARLILKGTK